MYNTCPHFIFPLIGPSVFTVNIMKNIMNSSIVVQWDAVDDSLHTAYTIIWTDDRDLHEVDTVDEQTSYTITGLTLDTVYIITVTAANIYCGSGSEFRTSVSLSTDMTSTTSTISPTVTSTVDPMSIIKSATTTATITIIITITASGSAITTTNSMIAAVSRDTVNTIKATTSLTAHSSTLGTTIATTRLSTTTVIKCFGMYTLLQ